MKKVLKVSVAVIGLVIVLAMGFLALSPGLRSDPEPGLSPTTHQFGALNVRDFTQAPLGAEVKVFLPVTQEEAMVIVADLSDYPNWVVPAPDPATVTVDNSRGLVPVLFGQRNRRSRVL